MTRIVVLALLFLLAVEIGPPVLKGNVPDGLIATGEVYAHDKPPKDPPHKDPPKPEPPKPRDVDGVERTDEARYWFVVRATRPTAPVYGPFLFPEPECRGYERRFPTIYRCVRLP